MSENQSITIFEKKTGAELAREPGISQFQLQKGLKIKFFSNDEEISGTVANWFYEVPGTLHVIVEIEEATFDNLDADSQEMLSMGVSMALVILLFLIFIAGYSYRINPTGFYGFIGYYMGYVIPTIIFIVGLAVLLKTKGYAQKRTIKGQIVGLIYTVIWLALLCTWYFYLRPESKPKTYPDDYAKDVFDLGTKLYDNLIIPIISIGWLSGIIKLLGWKGFADAFDTFINIFKSNKKES